jgi:2-furoyl-CoA dehydrogenase large subunit
VRLDATPEGTRIDYEYSVAISGKVAAVGGRLLEGAAQVVMRQFFERLARHAGRGDAPSTRKPFVARLRRTVAFLFGGNR